MPQRKAQLLDDLADSLRACPSIEGVVAIPATLATQIEEALRDAAEYVRVPRLGE